MRPGGRRGPRHRPRAEHSPVRGRAGAQQERDDPGRRRVARHVAAQRLRGRRRGERPVDDHRGDRAGQARRVLHRPAAPGAAAGGRDLRRAPARGGRGDGAGPVGGGARLARAGRPARAARRDARPLDGRDRADDDRGGGPLQRQPLPRLRRLLRVPRVRRGVPRRRDPARHARGARETVEARSVLVATGFQLFDAKRKPTYGFGKLPNVITSMQMDRILAPTRPYNAVVRPVRRQGAGQHRLRAVHRLARLHGGQPAVLAGVLHVLDQAGAAPDGRAAAGRHHDLLHRHPRLRQGLRGVLRAGEGDGRAVREGQGGQDRAGRGRQRDAVLRGHRGRRRAPEGGARPRGALGRAVGEPRGVRPLPAGRARGGRVPLRARGGRGPRAGQDQPRRRVRRRDRLGDPRHPRHHPARRRGRRAGGVLPGAAPRGGGAPAGAASRRGRGRGGAAR